MKQTLLLLFAFTFSVSVFAQNTVNITSAQYAAQKQNGTLDQTAHYVITDPVSFIPTNYSGESRTPSSICSCLIPLDSTFMLAMAPNDDGSSNLINIPFIFTFYGISYNSLFINNNGNISFTSPYSTFNANPFPDASYNMIAPFWGDVDTRDSVTWGTSGSIGNVYYKVTPTAMIVKWEDVGYYAMHGDKLNTFQLIITNGADTLLPSGTNVGFCYGDMQWTTGDASSGIMGFGGIPATVGNNIGNGIDYFQAGTFNQSGTAFDGPYASADGVDWLDNQGMYFDASLPGNMPPVIINNNICDTIDVFTGDTLHTPIYDFAQFTLAATTPEINQIVSAVITSSDIDALTVNQTMNTATYKQFDCTFSVMGLSPGLHYVTITATDDGTPAQTASRTIVIRSHFEANTATGITAHNNAGVFSIYPNPSDGSITVNSKSGTGSEIVIADVLGKTVLGTKLVSDSQTIDINNLPQGMYFATLLNNDGSINTIKFIRK